MKKKTLEIIETIGDSHALTSIETPLRKDAFKKSDKKKLKPYRLILQK